MSHLPTEFDVQLRLKFAQTSALEWKLPNGDSASDSRPTQPLQCAAVIGGGTMGRGIALSLVRAGFQTVTLVEQGKQQLTACESELVKVLKRERERGRLTDAEIAVVKQRLRLTLDFDEIRSADLVIEAVFEDMRLKEEVFKKLDRLCKPTAILGTNTSSLDIDRIALATVRPSSVVGIHFFNPAHLQKTVEVVRGKYTGGTAVATAFHASTKMGKIPVLVANCPAFLFNRMLHSYVRQAMRLLSVHGYYPRAVDDAFRSFGFNIGPLTMFDLNGIDVSARLIKEQGWKMDDALMTQLVELGRYGRKTGNGFYHYLPKNGKKVSDSEVERMIDQCSKSAEFGAKHRALEPRIISQSDMIHYALYPMVNEGLRCLDEGIVENAAQIDLMFIHGMDWPLATGGPMMWAERCIGYDRVHSYLGERYLLSGDSFWKPARSLENGRRARL